ncbi:hypothetical protein [Saccharopolyspora hattusasensis]|uniref:hypothetical protein n=1 Tax=Saccharopolyspora hattusasensis TaxID=1128679 RepID=UPI003D97BBEA
MGRAGAIERHDGRAAGAISRETVTMQAWRTAISRETVTMQAWRTAISRETVTMQAWRTAISRETVTMQAWRTAISREIAATAVGHQFHWHTKRVLKQPLQR